MSSFMELPVTAVELHILFHTLGVKPREPAPIEFYRNHFCVGGTEDYQRSADWPSIESLESKGLMAAGSKFQQRYSFVTDFGIKLVREIRGTAYAEDVGDYDDESEEVGS